MACKRRFRRWGWFGRVPRSRPPLQYAWPCRPPKWPFRPSARQAVAIRSELEAASSDPIHIGETLADLVERLYGVRQEPDD
jgi:hypothetical protein